MFRRVKTPIGFGITKMETTYLFTHDIITLGNNMGTGDSTSD